SSASTKQPMVTPMVIQRARTQPTSRLRNPVRMRLGLSEGFGRPRITTPSSGAKHTATIHHNISARPTTTKNENVYSPAELLAKPIGTKPAAVTKEPVSIGIATVL